MQNTLRIARLCFVAVLAAILLAILAGVPPDAPLQAQRRAPELDGNTETRFTLAAGAELAHYRLPFRVRLPAPTRVELSARGNFLEAALRPVSGGDFIVYMTSFRMRRSLSEATTLGAIFTPCPLPSTPENGDFDLTVRCAANANAGGERLERSLRLVRRGALLHLLYVSYRIGAAAQFAALERATLNPELYVPAESTPDPDADPTP